MNQLIFDNSHQKEYFFVQTDKKNQNKKIKTSKFLLKHEA